MERSENIKELATALAKYHAKAETVKKDGKNPHYKNDYATLDNILDTTRPVLAEFGLSILQLPVGENGLTTILLHESGEYISETYFMPSKQNDPQGNGSRLTYQRRYALGAILGVATEKDDDGNAASLPTKPLSKPQLIKDSQNYKNVVAALKDKFTIAQVKAKYELSEELEKSLLNEIK